MVTLARARFSVDDYLRLPEGFPAELIDGELVRDPAPTYGHQRLVTAILTRLVGLVGPGRVVPAPIDVFVDRHNVLQPDVLVTADPPPPPRAERAGLPVLVVEIASPQSAGRDRVRKADLYLEAGVAEVWLVDPEAGTVSRRSRGDEETCTGAGHLASRAVPGFGLSPAALFG